jgi:murein DD-endopeptidase MepM/ murein hydrolase activator NlpD
MRCVRVCLLSGLLAIAAPENGPPQPLKAYGCMALDETRNIRRASPPAIYLVDGTRISSGFGMRHHPIYGNYKMHSGIDIAAPLGAAIHVLGDGVVQFAGMAGGYGKLVRVRHENGYFTSYAHASLIAPGLHVGALVRRGEVIAWVGSSGLSTGPHLHLEILVNGKPIPPRCECSACESERLLPSKEGK